MRSSVAFLETKQTSRSRCQAWCKIGYLIALSGWVGRCYLAATASSLMTRSSHKLAMVSSVM
ncbi:hypothetical protein ACOSOMT5_P2885 [Acidiphilium sp. MT5]